MRKAHNLPIANTAVAFNKVYAGLQRPPWDTDGPTPFVQDLVQAGQVRGEVLDAGCGMGRFAEVVHAVGGEYVGVDYSFAVDAAQEERDQEYQRHDSHHVSDDRVMQSHADGVSEQYAERSQGGPDCQLKGGYETDIPFIEFRGLDERCAEAAIGELVCKAEN